MARDEELGEDTIENFELARNTVQRRVVRSSRVDRAFDLLEREGMVADLRALGSATHFEPQRLQNAPFAAA